MSARRWETTDDEEEEWETDDEEDESETEDETPRTTARVEVEKEEGALRTEEQKEDVIRMHESSWMTVSQYRREWDEMWSTFSGSFEDTKSDPVIIEVDLKVKGATESDDECLGFLVKPVVCFGMMYSHLLNYAYTCNHSTLELKLGHIISSVEATIFVRVTHGSWPDGLRGVFAASTTGIYDKYTAGVFLDKRVISIGHERIVLLDFRSERLPVAGDGEVKLSRRVVSVETSGKVIVRAKALGGDKGAVEVESSFEPLEAGSSVGVLEFSFCKMEVTVFWSLISEYP